MDDLIDRALAEDVGAGDLTTAAVVPEGARASARIHQKGEGVLAGLSVAEAVFRRLEPSLGWRALADEGTWSSGGVAVELSGSAAALLGAERVALNFLGRLSGIATLTARFVRAVEGTGVRILDTRKTTPGLRRLEKEAVLAGGGHNHRAGLYDAVLIKENHAALAGGVAAAVRAARERAAEGVSIEVECASPTDIDEALEAGARHLLLDNMSPEELREAVRRVAGQATLEASGGIGLENVRAVAETGVADVSVGALTHSAPVLDLSLQLEPL